VTAIPINKNKVLSIFAPDELADLKAWLIWRYEQNPKGGKPRKVPYYASGSRRNGTQNSPEDIEQLTNFAKAKAEAINRGFDGVGIALREDLDLVALDFDDVVIDGQIHTAVADLVEGTYAEFSPSGKGIRAFFHGSNLANRKSLGPNVPFPVEFFTTKGFVTFTGNRLPMVELTGDSVEPLSARVTDLYAERFTRPEATPSVENTDDDLPLDLKHEHITSLLEQIDPDLAEPDWMQAMRAVHHYMHGHELGLSAFDVWSATGSKYASHEDIEQRWARLSDEKTDQPTTIGTLRHMVGQRGGTIPDSPIDPSEFEVIKDLSPKDYRFRVVPAHEFAQGQPPQWMIKGVLPRAQLAVLFGESGSGKSFAALDMAVDIAMGTSWRDLTTKKGRVVYIAAEGAGGFRKRLKAIAFERGLELEQIPIGVIADAPNLMEGRDAKAVAQSIVDAGGADLVIVDTFAQTMPGANENAGEDVGKALAHCKGIHAATGALVMLVHHSGKDSSKGARGWSGLRAAADVELEVVRADEARSLSVTKQKDGEDGAEFAFKLQTVVLGIDEDGEEITSCVVEHGTGKVARVRDRGPRGSLAKLVMSAFYDLKQLGSEVVEYTQLKQAVIDQLPHDELDGRRDTRPQRVTKAIEDQVANGRLRREGVGLRAVVDE
jgi:hypothetical protein